MERNIYIHNIHNIKLHFIMYQRHTSERHTDRPTRMRRTGHIRSGSNAGLNKHYSLTLGSDSNLGPNCLAKIFRIYLLLNFYQLLVIST